MLFLPVGKDFRLRVTVTDSADVAVDLSASGYDMRIGVFSAGDDEWTDAEMSKQATVDTGDLDTTNEETGIWDFHFHDSDFPSSFAGGDYYVSAVLKTPADEYVDVIACQTLSFVKESPIAAGW